MNSSADKQELAAKPAMPIRAPLLSRFEKPAVVLLLILFVLVSIFSARPKSPSGDTLIHYGFGQHILGVPFGGEIQFARHGTSPVSALFVLSCQLRVKLTPWLGPPADAFPFFGLPLTLPSIFWSYLPVLLMAVSLLLILWWFIRRHFGPGAAFCTLLLSVLEPNLIAHSHYATTDMASALGFLSGCVAIGFYLERPSLNRALLMGLILGLAQIAKLPNLLLYPLAVLLCVIQFARAGKGSPFFRKGFISDFQRFLRIHGLALLVILPAMLIVCLQAAYAGVNRTSFNQMVATSPHKEMLEQFAGVWYALRSVMPPLHSYTIGYAKFFNEMGNWSYLAGEYRIFGWWYYYAAAILLKVPLPVLVLGAAGLFLFLRHPRRTWPMTTLLFPAILYFLYFSFTVTANVGVRHMLPVFSAMLGLGGLALSRIAGKISGASPAAPSRIVAMPAIVAAWLAIESTLIFPHYEEYFNQIAGGSNNGWKWLGDSNLDFGQEYFIVKRWVKEQNMPVHIDPLAPVAGRSIIRATMLIGHTPEMTSQTAWLREHFNPVEQPTPALLVYDVTQNHLEKLNQVPRQP